MKELFSEVNKQLKESKQRWADIDKVVAELKEIQAAPFPKATDDKIITLLFLLVEQLRPMQASAGQAEDMQKEINDMLGSIAKMVNK